jgi:hypothetical protein
VIERGAHVLPAFPGEGQRAQGQHGFLTDLQPVPAAAPGVLGDGRADRIQARRSAVLVTVPDESGERALAPSHPCAR